MNPGKLILACRSKEKGEKAVATLQQETGYDKAELWLINLAQFSSVVAFADKFVEEGGRLDLLILNAGVVLSTFSETSDGWEESLQVNNLAQSLLAILLLPRILETATEYSTTPRIVAVSSEVHLNSKFSERLINSENPLKTFGSKGYCIPKEMKARYADSKMLNVFFVRALNDHLRDTHIIVNAVNAGFCLSEVRRSLRGTTAALTWLMEKFLARTAEEGARQIVWAVVGGHTEPDRLRGAYISLAEIEEPGDYVISNEGQKAEKILWKNLIDVLANVDPRVRAISNQYL